MSILNQSFYRISNINICQVVKYSVSVLNSTNNNLVFKSNFTLDEEAKILNILNGANDQLARFSVSQNRIKNLEKWKSQKGPFRCLSDVLEVDGLGEKVLERICENIVATNENEKKTFTTKNNIVNKRNKQLLTPPLNGNLANLQSAVGIHLGPTGISWAKLCRERNKLTNWNSEDFSLLPKKMLPTDTFDLAVKIIRRIPVGDVYIFEANPAMSPQSQNSSASVSSYAQQLELTSMMIALLNTSLNHNVSLQKTESNGQSQKRIENRVFHLRSKIPARLFRTLVGTEKVAAITKVTELVENDGKSDFNQPCTPICLGEQLKNVFASLTPPNKELLGQALMLVVSFMDLCIYKNPTSIAAISPSKKNKH